MDNKQAEIMLRYVKDRILCNANLDLKVDTPLVSSGLVDSFALVEALVELEKITNLRIPAQEVEPMNMDTIEQMFETAAKFGKPRRA